MAGLSVKKELIDEISAVRQLVSDELPTVWIKDAPPVPDLLEDVDQKVV